MNRKQSDTALARDRAALPQLISAAVTDALAFLRDLDERPAGMIVPPIPPLGLPDAGVGAAEALAILRQRYVPFLSGSAGPRYFGFVTGGTTPAGLVGDWLTAVFDQNVADGGESSARQLTLDALGMVRSLLGLPPAFGGVFVTGATVSNTVGLALARQWIGRARSIDVAEQGVAALGPIRVLSGAPHSSVTKALAVLGIGRAALRTVPQLAGREAVDVRALELALRRAHAENEGPCIVVANSGTVASNDFDDLEGIRQLRAQFDFWLHVDGAFGAFAAAAPGYRHLTSGLEHADSITVDAHKWLNVPYDSAMLLTRHPALLGDVYRNASPYLPPVVSEDAFVHLAPENSQRLRALATWMTLAAYGRDGYAELVTRCCALAQRLGERIAEHPGFQLLAPIRLNGFCFALAPGDDPALRDRFLAAMQADGAAFMTPTLYRGVPAARGTITNWRTTEADIDRTWDAMLRALSRVGAPALLHSSAVGP
jgi:glutamate/tyrosine decarboxylase-like PLP-dependent enzyme